LILKLLLFGVIGLLIYRFFGGELPSFGKSKEDKKIEEDTLVECENCSTYVTVKESIIVGGKYYCSTQCTP